MPGGNGLNARLTGVRGTPASLLYQAPRHAFLGRAIDWLLPTTLLVTGLSLRLVGELTPIVLGCIMFAAVLLRPAGAGLLAASNLALAALVAHVSVHDAAALAVFPVAIGFIVERWRGRALAAAPSTPQSLALESFHRSRDGVVLLDADAHVVDANEAFCAMVGYDHGTIRGASVMLWQSEHSLEQIREMIRSGEIEQRMVRLETVHQRKDGSRYPVEVSARLVDLEGRRFVIGFVRDISDRREGDHSRAQQAAVMAGIIETQTQDLAHARAEVASVERAKDCFLANVSHQIRTPLHAIKAFSSLGLRLPDEQPERMRGYMDRIRASAEEMNAFVDDLVILSSLSPHTADCCVERLDIGLLLQQACMDMHERLIQQSLSLETDIQVKGRLSADPHLLSRLVMAMLSHACARGPRGSTITLVARFQGGQGEMAALPGFMIEVTDAGAPLSEAVARGAFDAYFKEELMDTQAASTSLLLAICRQIVHLHQGVIRFDHPAQGVSLQVWLPLAHHQDGVSP